MVASCAARCQACLVGGVAWPRYNASERLNLRVAAAGMQVESSESGQRGALPTPGVVTKILVCGPPGMEAAIAGPKANKGNPTTSQGRTKKIPRRAQES